MPEFNYFELGSKHDFNFAINLAIMPCVEKIEITGSKKDKKNSKLKEEAIPLDTLSAALSHKELYIWSCNRNFGSLKLSPFPLNLKFLKHS